MPCYSPLQAYRALGGAVVFDKNKSTGIGIKLSCGQCIGCRLEQSRQWAVRCMHEASLYDDNSFVTLTYNDDNLPADYSLDKSHFQKFMKRLRKKYVQKIRYFMCGEYGEATEANNYIARPHYHACIFNFRPSDLELYSVRDGINLYYSPSLEKTWGKGFVTVGDVNFDTAGYCARYCTKKITGEVAAEHYERVDMITGEIINLQPEYAAMSRRPGIGRGWYDKYKSDCYPSDFLIVNGSKSLPPRYYDKLYADEVGIENIKESRMMKTKKHRSDQTPERLKTRETVKRAQLGFLKRTL